MEKIEEEITTTDRIEKTTHFQCSFCKTATLQLPLKCQCEQVSK